MSEIKAVLLIPEEGDPHKLLKKGPCGARPPMAVRRTYPRIVHESNEWGDSTYNGELCRACGQPWPCETPGKVESEGHVRWKPGNRHTTVPDALVLAWDGEPVAEGLDRLSRAIRGHGWLMQREDFALAILPHRALSVARDTGTLVLLDAEGREVSDE